MLIGFSSFVGPEWDLPTLLAEGKALGFNAIELNGLPDHQHLPACPALADTPGVKAAFESADIQLLSMVADTIDAANKHRLDRSLARINETLDLADKLQCPYVIIKTASVPSGHNPDLIRRHTIEALQRLAVRAAELNIRLLLENTGIFVTSRDLWYVLDAVGHPALQCCWNPCPAIATGDSSSLSVPRLGRQIAVTHVLDAIFDRPGHIDRYVPLGHGQIDWSRYLMLMRGIGADHNLVLTCPNRGNQANPREFLAAALTWLQNELKRQDSIPELSAYKGDKNAPRYSSVTTRAANG